MPLCVPAMPVCVPAPDQLGELSEVLGCGCEMEFIPRAVRASQSQPIQPENPFEMGKQHLNFLSLSSRGQVSFRLGDIASHISRALMDRSRYFAGWLLWTTPRLEFADVAVVFAGAVQKLVVVDDGAAGSQHLTGGAAVAVILTILREVLA